MKRWKKKEGAISLWMVIVILIAVMLFSGLFEMTQRSFAIAEVQSIMDTAGVTALASNVSEDELSKWERYYRTGANKPDIDDFVNQESAIRRYTQLVSQDSDDLGMVNSLQHARKEIQAYEDAHGTGTDTRVRPQVEIDSVVILRVDSHPFFDMSKRFSEWFYTSRSDERFTISYIGSAGDGEVEIAIRSVTRVVYRR